MKQLNSHQRENNLHFLTLNKHLSQIEQIINIQGKNLQNQQQTRALSSFPTNPKSVNRDSKYFWNLCQKKHLQSNIINQELPNDRKQKITAQKLRFGEAKFIKTNRLTQSISIMDNGIYIQSIQRKSIDFDPTQSITNWQQKQSSNKQKKDLQLITNKDRLRNESQIQSKRESSCQQIQSKTTSLFRTYQIPLKLPFIINQIRKIKVIVLQNNIENKEERQKNILLTINSNLPLSSIQKIVDKYHQQCIIGLTLFSKSWIKEEIQIYQGLKIDFYCLACNHMNFGILDYSQIISQNHFKIHLIYTFAESIFTITQLENQSFSWNNVIAGNNYIPTHIILADKINEGNHLIIQRIIDQSIGQIKQIDLKNLLYLWKQKNNENHFKMEMGKDIKKIKDKHQKISKNQLVRDENIEQECLEMKERLINKMKKLSACKIENLYFNVGDLVVRNVWLLGNKYVNQRNMEILKELKQYIESKIWEQQKFVETVDQIETYVFYDN